jgi:hypothetical protein
VACWKEVGSDTVDHPAQSVNNEQDADDPWDIAGTKDQVSEKDKVNAKEHQAHGPIVAKGIE